MIKLSKVVDTTSPIVQLDTSFIDLLKCIVSYSHVFATKYGKRVFDTRIHCFIYEIISSVFLSSYICSTYVRYVRVTMLVLKHSTFLLLLKEVIDQGATTGYLGVIHVDDDMVYSATREHVNMMILARDCNVKNHAEMYPGSYVSFYKHRHLFLEKMQQAPASRAGRPICSAFQVSRSGSADNQTKNTAVKMQFFNPDAIV